MTAFVVFLFMADVISGGKVRALVRSATTSVSVVFQHIGADLFGQGYFTSQATLAAENAALKAELTILQERAALATALQGQVAAISSLAHLTQETSGITAPVTSSVLSSPYGTFLIGAGGAEGVALGAVVLSENGVVVGSVSDVRTHSATVLEIFASGHSENALLDGTPIVTKGAGGSNATTQVPHGITVSPGDAVTDPSLGGRVIGLVGHVEVNPSSAAAQVYIGSPVNLASLQYVYVLSSAYTQH
jgi:cell shape-determining protein MreC